MPTLLYYIPIPRAIGTIIPVFSDISCDSGEFLLINKKSSSHNAASIIFWWLVVDVIHALKKPQTYPGATEQILPRGGPM